MKISFFTEDIDFRLKDKRKIASWITACARQEGFSVKSLSYILCSDEHLLQINQSYLKHNTLTDIITFDLSSSEAELDGEIYISVPRVTENAMHFEVTVEEEIRRVIIHGVLHLMGYKDKTRKQKDVMRKKEDAYLSLFA